MSQHHPKWSFIGGVWTHVHRFPSSQKVFYFCCVCVWIRPQIPTTAPAGHANDQPPETERERERERDRERELERERERDRGEREK